MHFLKEASTWFLATTYMPECTNTSLSFRYSFRLAPRLGFMPMYPLLDTQPRQLKSAVVPLVHLFPHMTIDRQTNITPQLVKIETPVFVLCFIFFHLLISLSHCMGGPLILILLKKKSIQFSWLLGFVFIMGFSFRLWAPELFQPDQPSVTHAGGGDNKEQGGLGPPEINFFSFI